MIPSRVLPEACDRYLRILTVLGIGFIIALLFLNMLDGRAWLSRTIKGHPFTLLDVRPVKTEGRPGDSIAFTVVASRDRICPADIYGFWRLPDQPTEAFARLKVPGGFSPVGEVEHVITTPIPRTAPAGTVTYDWLMESICEDGRWIFSSRDVVGDLKITVLSP